MSKIVKMRSLSMALLLLLPPVLSQTTAFCPDGKHRFTNCTNPCLVSDESSTLCKSSPEAECRPEYCGGCVARFFDKSGKEIHCEQEEGVICELKTNSIGCLEYPGTTINITFANYGRTSRTTCEHPYGLERLHNDTDCRAPKSLEVVKELCQQRVSCTLTADATLFGEDPCYGIYKYLEIDFECIESRPCPEGSHYFTNCSNPCLVPDSESTQCKSSPEALCQPDYCGGCIARFFDIAGKEIHCEEEEGLICEQKSNTITCAGTPGTTLNIIYANYGRTSKTVCKHPYGLERLHNDTNCRAPGSLATVRRICQDKVACTLTADINLFGEDPCYGVYKYLEFDFECIIQGHEGRPSSVRPASLSHVLIPCAVLAILAICLVLVIIWRVRARRKRQGRALVSFVEMVEHDDEENGVDFKSQDKQT